MANDMQNKCLTIKNLTKMKQLAINVVKNTAIENLACSPNTIVLLKQTTSTNATTGEVTTTTRFIEVCPIEKTEPIHVIQNLLKYVVAEFFVCKELETDFADTKITQRKLFNQFLTGDKIYRTDSAGKIAGFVESEVPLNRTALRVQKTHSVVLCKPENRKAAIYQHAKAVMAQCKYFSLIRKKAEAIDKDAEKAAPARPAPARRTQAGATAPATAAA